MVSGLPSVPEAYTEYAYWARITAAPYGPRTRSLANRWTDYWRAREAWIDAEWRVNCASWRWVSAPSLLEIAEGDEWLVWDTFKLAERWKFSARHRRAPRKDLMLRDKGVVV